MDGLDDESDRILLSNPAFKGFGPRIIDRVFTLDKYACDIRGQITLQSNLHNASVAIDDDIKYESGWSTIYFTTFEKYLIGINVLLLLGLLVISYVYVIAFSSILI